MFKAYGLHGHIRNNTMKSALLLAGFVVLMMVFWYAWCIIYTAILDGWLGQSQLAAVSRAVGGVRRHAPAQAPTVVGILDLAMRRAIGLWWLPLAFSALWFAFAYITHAQLIRAAVGAREISRRDAPKLYNAVETLAIGAGLPTPRVEIIYTDALNAFASGLDCEDACITVTSGLLAALTQDELEAVLAHEMTHIRNNDVQLMVVATVFAGGLTLVGDAVVKMVSNSSATPGDVAYAVVPSRKGDNDGSFVAVLISLAIAALFLALTHIFSLVIKFALSRAREFLADAGAVELTKNPDALISALQKISGHADIPGINRNMQAMMISSDVESLLATHPPIATRIIALQQYAGGRIAAQPRRAARVSTASGAVAPASAMGFAGGRATFGKRGVVTG